jgi:Tol biopolymer transport system component
MIRSVARPILAFLVALSAAACQPAAASSPVPSEPTHPAATDAPAPTPSPTPAPPIAGPAIAYQWMAGSDDGIYLMAADGTGSRLLSGLPGSAQLHPDWSPDGSQIAFEAVGLKAADLDIASADGSHARTLVERNEACTTSTCGDAAYPAWSPDGKRIAFVSYDFDGDTYTGASIEVVDVASGTRRVIHHELGVYLNYPRWSPDGRLLVFETSPVDGRSSWISVIDAGTRPGTPTRLTDPSMFATFPDWRRAGGADAIVFTTYDLGAFQQTDEPSNLYTIHPDGTGQRQLTQYGAADTRATQPSWTPDGRRILFTLVRQSSGQYDNPRRAAFIDADGTRLTELGIDATHPRLQPAP